MIDTQRKHTIRIENSHQFNHNKPFDMMSRKRIKSKNLAIFFLSITMNDLIVKLSILNNYVSITLSTLDIFHLIEF